ncbi:MAG: hypothetical protein H6745_30685 [Deltaproteobacteria bacterium]|nr:hypothetical protein [Deltaproteobacteria bacterium]
MTRARFIVPVLVLAGLAPLAAACGSDGAGSGADTAGGDTAVADDGADGVDADTGPEDTASDTADTALDVADTTPAPVLCLDGLPQVAFRDDLVGPRRGDVAADFGVPLVGGGAFRLADAWDGCGVVVVLTDVATRSDVDDASLWGDDAGLAELFALSPDGVDYVFVPLRQGDPEGASADLAARLDTVLAGLGEPLTTYWRGRVHVGAVSGRDLDGWVSDALLTRFQTGFVVDRAQRLHGVGSFSDVTRYDAAAAEIGWPWQGDIAYAAYEAQYVNADAAASAALAAEELATVPLFGGEVLEDGFAEVDAALPADLASYDALWVEATLRCPDPDANELGNCGAWDYLARLWVRDGDGDDAPELEVARFITAYHRETHWIVDASALLPRLPAGATRHFRWEWAPSWNTQPTATSLRLVLGRRGGPRPAATTSLFTGGPFDPGYNEAHDPMTVPIPASAQKVELWAIVTGHGSGTSQCAEFCGHQHQFIVNGALHLLAFPAVGDDEGCIAAIASGMTPNQAGTWWLGRGGWCPGAPVAPWIVDVTGDVTPGEDATIDYRALLAGAKPPEDAGEIVLTSYLVVYE